MSKGTYDSMAPMPNKFLNPDGTTSPLQEALGGESVSGESEEYESFVPLPNKFLNPDGTTSTLAEILEDVGGESGGGIVTATINNMSGSVESDDGKIMISLVSGVIHLKSLEESAIAFGMFMVTSAAAYAAPRTSIAVNVDAPYYNPGANNSYSGLATILTDSGKAYRFTIYYSNGSYFNIVVETLS